MSRRALGPRLYLRRGRIDRRTGERIPDRYFIRDGAREIGTGFGPDFPEQAETALGEYIASKWSAAPTVSTGDPAEVLVAEVLAYYAEHRAPELRLDAATLKGFIKQLQDWWGEKSVADVRRSTCKEYVANRTSMPHGSYKDPATAPRVSSETARRELEVLGGAIGYWHGEFPLQVRPEVWLPDKPESPRDALTRPQAAALLKAAMGYRMVEVPGPWRPGEEPRYRWQRLGATARTNRRHLRRFILIGLYTGTRHTVMRKLLWKESTTDPWVDLDKGMIYRRGRAEREVANKRRPVVKLPSRLLAHMKRWQRLDEAAGVKANTVLHFGGEPIAGLIRTGFETCVADARLDPDVSPHWMRHSAATWLMERNVELWLASSFMGMNPNTLIQHYGHHRSDYQGDASDALSRAGRA